MSRQQLLIRSHWDQEHRHNLDLVFEDVSYIRLPVVFVGLVLATLDADELAEVRTVVGDHAIGTTAYALQTVAGRYVVAAAMMHAEENDLSFTESNLNDSRRLVHGSLAAR